MLHDPREVVIGTQQDEGEALVIAQMDVERRAEALDQLRLEQQRLGLRIGGDYLHAARLADHTLQSARQPLHLRVIRHPVLERARLADIERSEENTSELQS